MIKYHLLVTFGLWKLYSDSIYLGKIYSSYKECIIKYFDRDRKSPNNPERRTCGK